MRYRKTPSNERCTYILRDEYGRAIVEIKPGDYGVTAHDIKNYHTVDDHEEYVNCKEIRFTPFEKEQYLHNLETFIEQNNREPDEDELPSYRHFISIEDNEDLCCEVIYDETPTIIRLHEIIEEMPLRWQQVYKLALLDGYTNTETARMLSISETRVRTLRKKIIEKIQNDQFLKKFFE